MQDKRLERIDRTRLRLKSESAIPVNIFANDEVPIEPAAVSELLSVLQSEETLARLRARPDTREQPDWSIQSVAVTPDFHKGAGIPIGTVLKSQGVIFPQAVGNDINCGMRLHTTGIPATEIAPHLDRWETVARRMYFEGGRQIPMSGREREALLTSGIQGLFACAPWDRLGGQWSDIARYGWHRQTGRIERHGSLSSNKASSLHDWIGNEDTVSYDDQIGSIGGGNHFVEIQRVEQIFDRQTAYAWGLRKGTLSIMVHSGSVGIGHIAGRAIREMIKDIYPSSFTHPENGIYPLASTHPVAPRFWDLLHNAANFAFANRMFLAASAVSPFFSREV
ncbi:MAG: RtcB family protein [Acidobacteria bacterium]|nr:RtcB family protein [Acidobacteriota bacterium]